jgi:hypothetical protein
MIADILCSTKNKLYKEWNSMKKILVTLLVISAMVFAMAAAALASEVYLDGLVSGDLKDKCTDPDPDPDLNYNDKYDLKGYTLGTNLNFGRLLFNLEYSKDTAKYSDGDVDLDTLNIRCGYILFGDEQSYWALTAGYHQMEPDEDSYDVKYNGTIIGLNAVSNFSEKSRLEGFVGYSVDGSYKLEAFGTNDKYDLDTLLLQVKYSYYFTDNFGIGLGYKLTKYKYEEDTSEIKNTYSGPTIGLTYRF